jgi:ribosomal protein L13
LGFIAGGVAQVSGFPRVNPMTLATSTVFAKPAEVRGDWFIVDAADKTLGRLASQIAHRLRGKHKADYSPHVDMGDHIVVVTAQKIRVTGRKLTDKIYYHHTGYNCMLSKDANLPVNNL